MNWGAIGKAINDTLLGGRLKPLNRIIGAEAHNSFYNTMSAYVSAYGDNDGAVVIVPYGTEEVTGYENNITIKTIVLPSTVKTIGQSAFSGCENLESIVIPYGVTSILYTAFQDCTSLKTIFLPGSIVGMRANSFSGCTNLTDIYVGWSEGDILSAPWGATNATIHYDSGV